MTIRPRLPAAWYRRGRHADPHHQPAAATTALVFAAFFLAVSLATAWVQSVFGQPGIFALAALVGVSDIAPLVLGLAQGAAGAWAYRR